MATEPCGLLPISPRDGNQSEWHRWQRVHWQYYTHADIHGLCRSLIILKLMAMIFPFACWLILVIIWLQQMYLYAFMFPDHTTSKTSGLHQCLWGSLCSFVGLSFCPSPGAWYADAKKDSCTVLQMQHVLKKVPWARWLLNSLYVWVQKVSMIVIRYRYTMVLWMGIQPYTV